MNKEFLQDYKAKESAKLRGYMGEISKITEGSELVPYFDTRIQNATPPLVIADTTTFPLDGQKIWSQVAFAGTLLIPLRPATTKDMLNFNGFDVEEIEELIMLSKDEGKIHFCLPADPLLYVGLDHLDPIFKETDPLTLASWHPTEFITKEELKEIKTEVATIAKINYKRFVLNSIPSDTYDHNFFKYFMGMNQDTYVNLKILGLKNTTDLILEKMIDSPRDAARLFNACGLLIDPLFQIIRAHENNSLSKLQEARLISSYKSTNEEFENIPFLLPTESRPQFPIEIGKFLTKKLALNPSNYDGCKLALDKYKDNGLYELLLSLDKGIADQSADVTLSSIEEINTVMENTFNDAKRVGKLEKLSRVGVNITVGLAGIGLTQMLPTEGILTSLGILILNNIKDETNMGKRIARKISKDYLVNIYDFTKKHSI